MEEFFYEGKKCYGKKESWAKKNPRLLNFLSWLIAMTITTIFIWWMMTPGFGTPYVHYSVSQKKVVAIYATTGESIPLSALPNLKFDGYTYVQ